jgi:hypothetical protein
MSSYYKYEVLESHFSIKLPEYTEEYTDSTEPVEVEEAREEF